MSEEKRLGLGIRIGFVVFATMAVLAAVPIAALASGYFRLFYIPSEAMLPTLQLNDRFVGKMGVPDELNRGDIVLLGMGNSIYVKRIAALPGDTIELADGIVILNGRPVAQRAIGVDRLAEPGMMGDRAARLSEQFPGEAQAHQIYDSGESVGDDYPRIRIPDGHVFVLGDNRDSSADSRFAREEQGVGGAFPIAEIRGRPWWYYGLVPRDRGRSAN